MNKGDFWFLVWHVRSAEIITLSNNKKKTIQTEKPTILLGYTREVRSQGKLPPNWRHQAGNRIITYQSRNPYSETCMGTGAGVKPELQLTNGMDSLSLKILRQHKYWRAG